jgi:hypothetical protein
MTAIPFTYHIDLSSRRKRKDATAFVIDIIKEIHEAELQYRERYIPSYATYTGEPTADRLFEAIWILFNAFD